MVSRTEEAINALVAALQAANTAKPNVLPAPVRGETLPSRMPFFYGSTGGFLNVVDGSGGPEGSDGGLGEYLGAETIEDGYEIVQRSEVEWIVEADEKDVRDAAFDAGLIAIDDSLKADRALGGVVDWAAIEKIERSHLATDGLPNVKACIITVALCFKSDRPF